MTENINTPQWEPVQLLNLLKLHMEVQLETADGNKDELLHDVLTAPLPLDKEQISFLPDIISQACHNLGLLTGQTIQTFLLDKDTDIDILRRIKNYGKELICSTKSENQREVGGFLYYAAIAQALVGHDCKITSLSFRKLEYTYSRLLKENWVSHDFHPMFKIALQYCQEKRADDE